MSKINVSNVTKPIIYNLKNGLIPKGNETNIFNSTNLINNINYNNSNNNSNNNSSIVSVPYPVLIDKFNIVAKSTSSLYQKTQYYGLGQLVIQIYPFDNIITFIIEQSVDTTPKFFDLSNLGQISFVIKNNKTTVNVNLYDESTTSGGNNLQSGIVTFKIQSSNIPNIKSIYNTNNNVFYITSTLNNVTTVIYTGLFKIYDSTNNISYLNNISTNTLIGTPYDPNSVSSTNIGTAIVTTTVISGTSSN